MDSDATSALLFECCICAEEDRRSRRKTNEINAK